MNKLENIMDMARLNELLGRKEEEKRQEKTCNVLLWVLAIVGAVAAVAGIAYAVYRFFAPDYLEDFEDDFDDDFEDEDDDDDVVDFYEDETEE